MRVLVTGGAGFIGSHIVDRLTARGHQVTVVDNLSTGRTSNLNPDLPVHPVSIADPGFAELCTGMDALVHAAAQTSVAVSVTNPGGDATTNVLGTIHAVQAAVKAKVGRVVYLSSAAVYGVPLSVPVPESQPPCPLSPYGLSKLGGELYLRLLAEPAGIAWTTLRLANVYGPRQSVHGEAGVIARWCHALIRGEPIILEGDGKQTRDFVYVKDVAEAVSRAIEAPGNSHHTLNISTGAETPLTDLLTLLESAMGRTAKVEHRPPRPGDIRRSVLVNSAALMAIGWRPDYSLRQGLAETVAWLGESQVIAGR